MYSTAGNPPEPLPNAEGADAVGAADGALPASPAPQFDGAPTALVAALTRRGFTALTAVQRAVLDAGEGARDLRISSQTGSGKTVALGFALLDGVVAGLADAERPGPTTLVIVPTRELAMQVKDELSWLFADVAGARCDVVTGGTNLDREFVRLRRRPAILVGTPGRLCDHVRRGGLDLSAVHQLVLDEADQMLDLGFKDELDELLAAVPAERRTHLVSATFPAAVQELADRCQRDALAIEGTDPGAAHADIEHLACRVQTKQQYEAVVNLLLMAGDERTLVFVRTREDTATLADRLAADGFGALPLNGDLAQAQRTRTLQAFKSGSVKTLVATDVAARGIDVADVTTVIHVDLPIDPETYVHRSGRTGRAGQKGKSVLLVPKARAARSERLYRILKIAARWVSPPTADQVRARLLERAEGHALAKLTAGRPLVPAARAAAATLLRERDPIEVVAALLTMTVRSPRDPFELQPSPAPVPTPRRPAPAAADAPGALGAPGRRSTPLGDRRGRPGAAASWRRDGDAPAGEATETGFARFRINWGARDGADPRRVLAHVCRRGDVDSRQVGSISVAATATTFEVCASVAASFARRAGRRDRRDPHLFIERDGVLRARAPRR